MEAVMLHHNRKLDRQFTSPRSEFYYPNFPLSSSFNGGAAPYTPPFSFQGPMDPRVHHFHHQQPPLLPLPFPNPYQNNNRKINNNKLTRHQSLSVKKSNFSGPGPKREKPRPSETYTKQVSQGNRLGPEPKDVPRVLFSGNSNIVNKETTFVASSVVSPPPSSLPLPTFIRPKLSCKAVAVVDAGATDSLRRVLHLP